MKTYYSLLCGALLSVASLSTHATSLSLVPSSLTAPVGTSINLDLIISGLGNHTAPTLGGFDIDLGYDSSLLGLTDITFGPALGNSDLLEALNGSGSVTGGINIYAQSLLEANATTCIFCSSPYLEDLQTSSFTLASLTFQTAQPGPATFNLSLNQIVDGYGDHLTTTVNAMPSVQIAPVPVPAALWLFSAGLTGLGYWRRKRVV